MRISNYTMARNYRNNLSKTQARLYEANMKSANPRRFNYMSEDVSGGLRAFKVRRELVKVETYMDNTREVDSYYKAAEDNITHIVEVAREAASVYSPATSGHTQEEDYPAIEAQMKRLQEEILNTLNGQLSSRYLFGGSQVDERPFSTDAEGYLTYKGVKVADMDKEAYEKMANDPSYIDLGLGLALSDDKGEVVANTAYNRSIVGLNITGYGPDNLYDTISRAIQSLQGSSPDPELITQMNKNHDHAVLSLTKLGAETNFLDFNLERLTSEQLNLTTRQQGVEFIGEEEAILDFKMAEFVYNAALQMGSRLLQPSLFSFLS